MTLVRWNPARDLATMEIDRLNRMFGDFFDLPAHRSWVPAVDVYETDSHEDVIKAELPEIRREDISITFDNNVLSVKGERKVEQRTEGTVHRLERPVPAASSDRSRCRRPWTAVASAPATRMACYDSHASARGREAEADRGHSRGRDPVRGIRDARIPRTASRVPISAPPAAARAPRHFHVRFSGHVRRHRSARRRQAAAQEPAAPITSRFLFVDVAAQRAKQLRRGALPRIERPPAGPHKLERLAMEEVRSGASTTRCPKTSKASSAKNVVASRDLSPLRWELLRAPRRNSPLEDYQEAAMLELIGLGIIGAVLFAGTSCC